MFDVIENVCGGCDFMVSCEVLCDYGNMSSLLVLFVLEWVLCDGVLDEMGDWWFISFGVGFSVYGCCIGV